MPSHRHIGLAAAIASATILGPALPAFVAHADTITLYVDNSPSSMCSDTGTGTRAQPFCTIQAAANVVQAGQTVQIYGYQGYPEQVTVTHSGTPGNPIVFRGADLVTGALPLVGVAPVDARAKDLPHGFVLSGVHDVTVSGLQFESVQEAVLVTDSDRITLDADLFSGVGTVPTSLASAFPNPAPAVRLTGRTTATTVSRSRIQASGAAGVAVGAGVSGTVVTTNEVTAPYADGIVVTDAPGTVVTSNSITSYCHSAVTLAGNSAGSTIENNIVEAARKNQCPSTTDLSVSAGSTSGTKADDNIVPLLLDPGADYTWGTGTYDSPAAFSSATGQGGHDLAAQNIVTLIGHETAATDSADANAPGELATDLYGHPRVDDPNVPNTGTGAGHDDRGAFELQDPLQVGVSAGSDAGRGRPLDATAVVTLDAPWPSTVATVDFGDGSPKQPVSGTSVSVSHTYPAPGTYTITLTATDASGTVRTATTSVLIPTVPPIQPSFDLSQADLAVAQLSFTQSATSPWPVATFALDFGDGSPKSETAGPATPGAVTHTFPGPGTYTVTETVTDDHGRSATTSRPVVVKKLLPLNRTIEASQGGVLHEIHSDGQGWHDTMLNTVVPAPSALAFAYSPSGARVIEESTGGALFEIYSAPDGWHANPILGADGNLITQNVTALSFSYSPSGARVIEAIEGGVLHEIYSAPDGWHDGVIQGVAPNVSAMSFSYSASGARVIEANEGGVLHEIYSAPDGWHDNPIQGVAPNVTALSFVYNASGQRVIEAIEGGALHEVYSDWDGWHDAPVPGAGNGIKSLSVKVRPTGDRVIEAVENNELHEIYTNAGAWIDSVTPAPSGMTSASLVLR